jgi:hypothetical protein
MLKKHVCGLLYNDRKIGPTFCHAILYQVAVFVPTLSCEAAPLSKVDVRKLSGNFQLTVNVHGSGKIHCANNGDIIFWNVTPYFLTCVPTFQRNLLLQKSLSLLDYIT